MNLGFALQSVTYEIAGFFSDIVVQFGSIIISVGADYCPHNVEEYCFSSTHMSCKQ